MVPHVATLTKGRPYCKATFSESKLRCLTVYLSREAVPLIRPDLSFPTDGLRREGPSDAHSEDMRQNRVIYTHGHPENESLDAQWHNNRSQHPRQTGRVVVSLLRDLLPGREVEKCGAAALRREG